MSASGPTTAPRVSLCVLARDDPEHLATLLQEMQNRVDEMVVVDTGSRDSQTLRVARRAGARTARHAWRDDFAAARNAALDLARSDWVLFLDADERLTEVTPGALRLLIQRAGGPACDDTVPGSLRVPCYGLLYRQASERPGTLENRAAALPSYVAFATRLFPRHPSVRWVQPLYETPALVKGSGTLAITGTTEVGIVHLGHPGDATRAAEKRARNLRIVEAMLAREPEAAFTHFAAGREYALHGDYGRAAAFLERAVVLAGQDSSPIAGEAYVQLVDALRELGRLDEAIARGIAGLNAFPRADLDCAVGLAFLLRQGPGDLDQALRHYQRARSLRSIAGIKLGDQDALTWKPLWGMAHVFQQQGAWDRAAEAFLEALQYVPDHPALLRQAAGTLRKAGRPVEAAGQLRRLLALPSCQDHDDDDTRAATVALADVLVEAGDLQAAYDHLDAIVRQQPQVEPYRLRLADLLIEAREHGAAVDVLAAALDGDAPASSPIYQRLGEALTHLGRHEDAENAFQLALGVDPANEAARLGLQAVRQLAAAQAGARP